MSFGTGWWEILWLGWAWNCGSRIQTRGLKLFFFVLHIKGVLRVTRQIFIPEIWEALLPFSPSFSLLLVLLHFPCSFCSCLTLPPPSLLLVVLSPFPSGSITTFSEPLRDVLLLSRSISANWFPAVHFCSVIIPSCLLYSYFSLILFSLILSALIQVPIRNKWHSFWMQLENPEKIS